MRFVFYMQVYASFISSILLFVFPNSLLYTQFALLTAFLSTGLVLYYLLLRKIRIDHFLRAIMVCVLIAIAYSITDGIYVEKSSWYDSYRLVLFGQTIPLVLTSTVIGELPDYHIRIKKLVPYFAIVFAIVAISVTLSPRAAAQNLAGDEDANLNYQNTSYLAAYSASLAMYYVSCFKTVRWGFLFNRYLSKILFCALIVADFIIILFTGGRGGLAAFLISLLFFVFVIGGNKSIKSFFRIVLTTSALVIVGYYSVHWVMESGLSSSGFFRFTRMISEGDVSGRDVLFESAWSIFKENPFGHGLGGVFFLLGSYSHNIFLDMLIDVGLFGLLAFIALLFVVLRDSVALVKSDKSELFWLYLFIDGFVMNLFSGYFLSGFPWICSVFYIWARKSYYKTIDRSI